MRRTVLLFSIVLLAAASAFAAGSLSNRRAPGFSLPDVNLKQHDLQDYRGKLVVLNIMRTSCPHCNSFSKVLSRLEAKYPDQVKVLNIVNSPPDTQNSVRAYQQRNGLRQTVLFDCRQVAISYLKLTPQRSSFQVPHVFVIDEEGWIQEDYGYNSLNRGFFEGDGIFKVVEKHLGKASAKGTPRGRTSNPGS